MIDWIRKMWKKYIEVIRYLFFGGLATLLNIVLYMLFNRLFGYQAANGWANILDNALCILFAYGTNRTWVFESKTHGKAAWLEFTKFVTCRLGTMVIDAVIMYFGGNLIGPALVAGGTLDAAWLDLFGTGVKVFSNVIVIVLNYVFSKWIIFKKKA